MPISSDILSLDPKKVKTSILEIYDRSCKTENPAARALISRLANYVVTANENKSKKKSPALFAELDSESYDYEEPNSDHIATAEAGLNITKIAELLATKLSENVFTPALTAHPTNPKSLETDKLLLDSYNLLMLIHNEMAAGERSPQKQAEKNQTIKEKLEKLAAEKPTLQPLQPGDNLLEVAERYLEQCFAELSQSPLLPPEKLSVPQEVERNLRVFGVFFGEFNKFKHRIINDFYKRYGVVDLVQKIEVAKILTPAIARQFQEIHFWSASDADGNPKITAETMLAAIKSHQQFLDRLYLDQITKLLEKFPKHQAELNAIAEIVSAEQKAEAAGRVEDAKNSKAIVARIDSIIDQVPEADRQDLIDLRDSFDCFGFVGPKMDVRQSSVRNVTAMQQILDFLHSKQILPQGFFKEYETASPADKNAFCHLLKNPDTLDLLARKESLAEITALAESSKKFSKDLCNVAQQELERMIVAKTYPDIVHRYIISDNKGVESWNEVRFFEAYANHVVNGPDIEDSRPLQVYPLCETSEDIRNLPIMIEQLLKDPEAIAQLKGRLDLFVGYSDAEKRSGTFALVLLQQKIFETKQIIDRYNEGVPEGQKLKVEIFQARGNDAVRGGGKKHHVTTDQGQAAVDFGFKQEAKAALLESAGRIDDFDLQMQQWEKMNPKKRDTIAQITEKAIERFEDLVSHQKDGKGHGDKLATFLEQVSLSSALKETNQSSRAPAKGGPSKKLNLDSERAIGLATRFSACGLPINLLGLGQISDKDARELSTVCGDLTVVQDIILKTIYALAISDEGRARKIAAINNVAEEDTKEMFEEFRELSFKALENVVNSLPLDIVDLESIKQQISEEKKKEVPVNEVAKLVMTQLSNQFPLIKQLQDSVVAYEEDYKPVVHNLLDQYQASDDLGSRAKIDKQLAVVFREEMRIPRVIDGLTSKAQFINKENAVERGGVLRLQGVGLEVPGVSHA